MPISKEQLASIIGGKARELCSEETMQKVKPKGKVNRDYFAGPDPNSFNDGGAAERFEAMCGFGVSEDYERNSGDIRYNEISASSSRMPDKIKQSMLSEKIDVSKLSPNASILDSLNIPQQDNRRNINEVQYQQQQMGAGFDSNYLKFIIKECLNEYFSQNQINESANGIQTIGLGKGYISIVDNKGDIYRAKLEKVGNKNNK